MSEVPGLLATAKAAVIKYELPPELNSELEREYERYELVDAQVRKLDRLQIERAETQDIPAMHNIQHLRSLKGVGWQSSWILSGSFSTGGSSKMQSRWAPVRA